MSKAFLKEDSENDDNTDLPDTLPMGTKNYITPAGADKLRRELKRLLEKDRPDLVKVVSWAASNGDRSENADYIYGKRKLREIDRRIRFLTKRLEISEIIDPASQNSETVLFGATVIVRHEDGRKKAYRIVGIDETDAEHGKVSWCSPIGKALLGARKSDAVTLKTPKGDEEIEVLEIRYESNDPI